MKSRHDYCLCLRTVILTADRGGAKFHECSIAVGTQENEVRCKGVVGVDRQRINLLQIHR